MNRHTSPLRAALPAVTAVLAITLAACGTITKPTTPQPKPATDLRTQALTWQNASYDTADSDGFFTSIALDGDGNPHIAFMDSTTGHLMYASYDPNATPAWTVDLVANEGPGQFDSPIMISLAFGHESTPQPHIAYAIGPSGSSSGYYVLKYASPGSTPWSTSTISGGSDPPAYPSLAFDNDGNPHVSYGLFVGGTMVLEYASYAAATGWTSVTAYDGDGARAGYYSSLAFDADGNPHISSYRNTPGTYTGKLVYSSFDPTAGWSTEDVDPGSLDYPEAGQYSSLAFDKDGNPCISYQASNDDTGNAVLRYACHDSTETPPWIVDTIDDTSSSRVGAFSSLAFDAAGNAHISYFDSVQARLKYAWYDGSWNLDTADNGGADLAVVGQHSDLAVDSEGNPYISYLDASNHNLKLAWLSGSTGTDTTPPTVDSVDVPTTTTSSTITATGTASDTGGSGLNRVAYALNTGSEQPCSGTSSFTCNISGLVSGSNSIVFYAYDGSDNKSTGVTRSVTYAPSPPTDPTDAIESLVGSVDDLDLKPGQARGLTNPLENALRSLPDHVDAACSQLQDFVTKVEAKTPTPVEPGDASDLISAANAIRDDLGCTY